MFKKRVSVLQALKPVVAGLIVLYAGVVTVALFKMSPQVILIGIDGKSARVISQDTDALLQAEKISFVFAFLESMYSFNQATFAQRSKDAKMRMSPELWRQRQTEISGIEQKIKEESLRQSYEVQSLREIDKFTYSAELKLRIERRESVTEVPLTVKLKLRKRVRDALIPYPIEVEALDERRQG